MSVLILGFNEEVNVERAIASVEGWAQEVFVLDSLSTSSKDSHRELVMFGVWLRWGGAYPSSQLRLIRHGRERFDERVVNEHHVADGKIGHLNEAFIHDDRKGFEDGLRRHNTYSTLEARILVDGERLDRNLRMSLFGSQPQRKRWRRRNVWGRVPLRPVALFLYSFVFRLGFLHGRIGYRYARLLSMVQYWTDLKAEEIRDRF